MVLLRIVTTTSCAIKPGRMERPPPNPKLLILHAATTSSCLRMLYAFNAAGISSSPDSGVDVSPRIPDRTLQSSATTRVKTKAMSLSGESLDVFNFHILAANDSAFKTAHAQSAACPQVLHVHCTVGGSIYSVLQRCCTRSTPVSCEKTQFCCTYTEGPCCPRSKECTIPLTQSCLHPLPQ